MPSPFLNPEGPHRSLLRIPLYFPSWHPYSSSKQPGTIFGIRETPFLVENNRELVPFFVSFKKGQEGWDRRLPNSPTFSRKG